MSHLPPEVHAVIAVALCVVGFAAFQGCWWLAENASVRHFFHSPAEPLCWRCGRDRRQREERSRHQQMIAELRGKHRRRA